MLNREYYSRQVNLIDPDKLNMPILVVGAGSIGSWTSLALLKLGCQDVTVVDFDDVGEENIGSQIYNSYDIGKWKVDAFKEKAALLVETLPKIIVDPVNDAHTIPSSYEIVISAVDNMQARKDIFKQLNPGKAWFLDGRMAANNIQVFATKMDDPDRVGFYDSTLFSSDDALPIACSERSVVYNCFVISGLLTDLVAKIANGKIPPKELIVDLENLTMFGGLDS